MSLIKSSVESVFSSLNYTREERENKFAVAVEVMRKSINEIILHHTRNLLEELDQFDETNWVVGDECGKTVLFLKDLIPSYSAEFGKMNVALKETGEVWMFINLDTVFADDFEPMFLTAEDRTLMPALKVMADEAKERIGLAGLAMVYEGKTIVAS